jgi:hypothetical protein
VLNLIGAVLDTRAEVLGRTSSEAGRQRIESVNPVILSWYGGEDFLSCCADQLRRLQPSEKRFILSHWRQIDGDDRAREKLAEALTSADPRVPDAIRDHDELSGTFGTLIRFNEYCRGQGRGRRSGGPKISLTNYLEDFEKLERPILERIISRMNDRDRIDIDTVMKLRGKISLVDNEHKGARAWAHEEVNREGGEDAEDLDPFLLEQRQLVDTLYNVVLGDSVGSERGLLSSVPRTVGSAELERVNAFALELVKYSREVRSGEEPAAARMGRSYVPNPYRPMSELFGAAAAEPDLPAPPLAGLLVAYWELITDDDRWLAWQDSCDHLQFALGKAERRRSVSRLGDAQLDDAWEDHLSMLRAQLPQIRAQEKALVTPIGLGDKNFQAETRTQEQETEEITAESLAAGEYIDRHLRGFSR